jgi:WD40 repeat protein
MILGLISHITQWHCFSAALAYRSEPFFVFTGRVCRVLSSHYQKVTCLAFTQDGAHFLSAGQDGQVIEQFVKINRKYLNCRDLCN